MKIDRVKKPFRLRTQITFLMVLLVLLQSFALLLALSVSRVFLKLDAEAFRMFNNATSTRMQTFNSAAEGLVYNMAQETTKLSAQLEGLAHNNGIKPERLYTHDDLYKQVALRGSQSLISLLQGNSITGAFFMLDGSNSNLQDANAHSSVYIRNSTPDSGSADTTNFLLELGPVAVAQQYTITTSARWDLDIHFDDPESGDFAFYSRPIWASQQYPNAEIERYGYWSAPGEILNDGQRAVCYTMPLLSEDGTAYGVLGIEISLDCFTHKYIPNTDLPYPDSFYAVAALEGQALAMDWVIPSGPLAQVYLEQGQTLQLNEVPGEDLYKTTLNGIGEVYCSVQPLSLYSENSPFYGENWSLIGFTPQAALRETSGEVRTTLFVSIAITTLASFVAIAVLAYVSTRKISDLSRYINSLSLNQDIRLKRTGMREIDELSSAVEILNRSVLNASKTTSKILELTLMPIGGYEVSAETGSVTLTEYLYNLLDIRPGTALSFAEWDEIYAGLTQTPAAGYEDVYHFNPPGEDAPKWLRIVQTYTEAGHIGVVADVSEEVEEHRRLAHALDFDALTHLYNRTAFKREVYAKISGNPDDIGAMIFSDLDSLKYINDNFGHDIGDRLIIRAGEMFNEFSKYGGIVSRISGDEFAVYLHGFSSKQEARSLIDKQFRRNTSYHLITPDGSMHRIRSSSGIAWYPEDSDNVTDLLKLSDFAMYEAKQNQKGMVFEFSQESYNEKSYLLDNREAINRLLDEGLIRFAFQPIVELKTGELFGYEALMRPMLDNFKSPKEVLSVAASQSKLAQLERLLILTALKTVDEHHEKLGKTKVFINSIPSQRLSDEDHSYIMRQYPHLFDNIAVEITEQESKSPRQLQGKVGFIRKAGMTLALDDFGSGYSNEMRILSIMPDIVKLDIEMIQGLHGSPDRQQLVGNIVNLCHPKGIRLIAEGVEEEADLVELIRLNVDYIQGYYIGRPAFGFCGVDEETKQRILILQALAGQE